MFIFIYASVNSNLQGIGGRGPQLFFFRIEESLVIQGLMAQA